MSGIFPDSDRIVLEGMRFYGFHGVNPEERVLGQEYLVDVTVELDLRSAGGSDRLEDTISYARVYRAVREVMEGEPYNLLEAAAQSIADRVVSKRVDRDVRRHAGAGHQGGRGRNRRHGRATLH